jgi:hypothetical protein
MRCFRDACPPLATSSTHAREVPHVLTEVGRTVMMFIVMLFLDILTVNKQISQDTVAYTGAFFGGENLFLREAVSTDTALPV